MQTGARLREQGLPGMFVLETERELSGVPVPIRLGAQSWGTLNERRDNAVLVCHYYTGIMRAAGTNPDGTPAWWDALIGPGKAIDTERFFVVCMNTLANAQVVDPSVISTGPDTPHPDGQLWGQRFPKWSFADLHDLQVELMRALGVEKWYAVLGPSLGGMQAIQWAARSPELTGRVGMIAASPLAGPVIRDTFVPMINDIAPTGGIEGVLRLITFMSLGADPLELMFRDQEFGAYIAGRAKLGSLNHIVNLASVIQTHDIAEVAPHAELFQRWKETRLKLLSVNILGDQFFPAAVMRNFAQASAGAGVNHEHFEYQSALGHLGCVNDTAPYVPALQRLLE